MGNESKRATVKVARPYRFSKRASSQNTRQNGEAQLGGMKWKLQMLPLAAGRMPVLLPMRKCRQMSEFVPTEDVKK